MYSATFYEEEEDAAKQEMTEEEKKAADVNRDGASDSSDAAKILQYAAEKIEMF